MRKPHKILVAIIFVISIVSVLVFLSFGGPDNPTLSVSYLGQTNEAGRLIAYFAVTNTGDSVAVSSKLGRIEVFGGDKRKQVASESSIHRLRPGERDVMKVFLPDGIAGRWRFTALYAHGGLRSWVFDLQWGRFGLGAHINWLVPRSMKGLRLDVNATSDWVEN